MPNDDQTFAWGTNSFDLSAILRQLHMSSEGLDAYCRAATHQTRTTTMKFTFDITLLQALGYLDSDGKVAEVLDGLQYRIHDDIAKHAEGNVAAFNAIRERCYELAKPWCLSGIDRDYFDVSDIEAYAPGRFYCHDPLPARNVLGSRCLSIDDINYNLEPVLNQVDPIYKEFYYLIRLYPDRMKQADPLPCPPGAKILHLGATPYEFKRTQDWVDFLDIEVGDTTSRYFLGTMPIASDPMVLEATRKNLRLGANLGDNLYIYPGLLSNDRRLYSALAICFKEVLEAEVLSPEKSAEYLFRARSEVLVELDDKIARLRRDLEKAEMHAANTSLQLHSTLQLWEASHAPVEAVRETILLEMQKILEMDQVVHAQIAKNGVLHVYTKTLYCTDDRTNIVHLIGEFHIQINLNPSNGLDRFQWRNLRGELPRNGILGMQAPHVFSDYRGCLGDFARLYTSALEQFEILALVSMGIQFIENCNTRDSAGAKVYLWDVAPAEFQLEPLPEGIVPGMPLTFDQVTNIAQERTGAHVRY